jgi:hypothetical protein
MARIIQLMVRRVNPGVALESAISAAHHHW